MGIGVDTTRKDNQAGTQPTYLPGQGNQEDTIKRVVEQRG